MAEQTPPPSPDASARARKKQRTARSVGCASVQVDVTGLTVDWASTAWDAPSHVDMLWRALHGAPFPWAHFARAGLEYLTNPDTGAPDFCRRALVTRLYEAEHGTTPPWSEWEARDWQ